MSEPFTPSPELSRKLDANRQGKLTSQQRAFLSVGVLFTSGGLLCMSAMLVQLGGALLAGLAPQSIFTWIFFLITLLTFGYLAATLFVNARTFIPDLLSGQKVKQTRGKLTIQLPQRERWELPFSYIVGDYSFAPFEVPDDVPMEQGREYIVYYLARTRAFLSIEPASKK